MLAEASKAQAGRAEAKAKAKAGKTSSAAPKSDKDETDSTLMIDARVEATEATPSIDKPTDKGKSTVGKAGSTTDGKGSTDAKDAAPKGSNNKIDDAVTASVIDDATKSIASDAQTANSDVAELVTKPKPHEVGKTVSSQGTLSKIASSVKMSTKSLGKSMTGESRKLQRYGSSGGFADLGKSTGIGGSKSQSLSMGTESRGSADRREFTDDLASQLENMSRFSNRMGDDSFEERQGVEHQQSGEIPRSRISYRVVHIPAEEKNKFSLKLLLTGQNVKAAIKQKVHNTSDNTISKKIRFFLRGGAFSAVSMLCLVIALYFPDLFVMLDGTRDETLDTILTLVFIFFALEWMILSLLDVTYLLSFFWFMDLVGTMSMAFDISYMLGSSAEEPLVIEHKTQTGGAQEQVALLRAARTAKLGARAGRISRVVKVLRFLPFLNLKQEDEGNQMARVISSQLTNVLGTRVACMTIVMVIAIPVLLIYSFPEYDYGLHTTISSLYLRYEDLHGSASNTAATNLARERMLSEYTVFNNFYSEDKLYGVYNVCMSQYCDSNNKDCLCLAAQSAMLPAFQWAHPEPDRISNRIHLSQQQEQGNNSFLVISYNMTDSNMQDALMNLLLITLVIVVMLVFGLVLTNAVSDLALKPMERMLSLVREIARSVFRSMEVLKASMEDEEEFHSDDEDALEHAGEVVLLEKVVEKLALMARVQRQTLEDTYVQDDKMNEEDKGMIGMMVQNRAVIERRSSINGKADDSMATTQSPTHHLLTDDYLPLHDHGEAGKNVESTKIEQQGDHNKTSEHKGPLGCKIGVGSNSLDPVNRLTMYNLVVKCNINLIGVTQDEFNSWDCDVMAIDTPEKMVAFGHFCIMEYTGCIVYTKEYINPVKLTKFLTQVQSEYYESNPYHNFQHGLDVLFTTQRFMRVTHAQLWLRQLEQISMLISAVCHDVGHPGLNNVYLVNSGHELALTYNDSSPLENFHASRLFGITVENEDCNIFERFSRYQYKAIRKVCVEVILHTDMAHHFVMIKDLQLLFLNNGCDDLPKIIPHDGPKEAEVNLLKGDETRAMMLKLILHAADVSNPMKPWHICEFWAKKVLEEFFAQGDREKELGLPVGMLNDRDKVNFANSQLGFLEFLVAPLSNAMVKLLPPLYMSGRFLRENFGHWAENAMAETTDQETLDKLKQRCDKILENSKEAETRLHLIEETESSKVVRTKSNANTSARKLLKSVRNPTIVLQNTMKHD